MIVDVTTDLEAACLQAFIAVFNNETRLRLGARKYPLKRTARAGLRYFDAVVAGKPYRFMEQNPRTRSKWARLAQEGHKILWVFKEGQYHARMVDARFTLLPEEQGDRPAGVETRDASTGNKM